MLHYNEQNEVFMDIESAPLFLMNTEHLAELKKQGKAEKGKRLDKQGKKALKLFRNNRNTKRMSHDSI